MAPWPLAGIAKDFRSRFQLSKAAAARVAGVSTLYWRSLEAGYDVKTGLPFEPRDATLREIALRVSEFGFPVTFDQLRAAVGKGGDAKVGVVTVAPHEIPRLIDAGARALGLSEGEREDLARKAISPSDVALIGGARLQVPFFGIVGCGQFIEPCVHPDGAREVPAHYLDGVDRDDYGTVEASGDSMNKARIFPGMTMLVYCTDYAQDGDVVLANIPYQGTTCKRYRVRPDGHWLVAESTTEYPPIKMDDEIKIVGVVQRAWLVTEF